MVIALIWVTVHPNKRAVIFFIQVLFKTFKINQEDYSFRIVFL